VFQNYGAPFVEEGVLCLRLVHVSHFSRLIMQWTLTLLCIVAVVYTAPAQIETRTLRPAESTSPAPPPPPPSRYELSLGAFLAAKAGVNTTVAQDYKTDVNINPLPDIGISIIAPFEANDRFGAGLDIGYTTYSYITKPYSGVTVTNTIIERYSYVNLFPHFNLYGVVVGVNVGFAPSGSAKTKADQSVSVVTPAKTELSSDELGTLIELRLGGNFPVWRNPTGHLNFYVMGGYVLGGLYSDYQQYLYSPNADNNPRPASLALGLAYYFTVPIK
jgi:hypothetical protein